MTKPQAFLLALSQNRDSASRVSSCYGLPSLLFRPLVSLLMLCRISRRVRRDFASAHIGGLLDLAELGEPHFDRKARTLMRGRELEDLLAGIERGGERLVFVVRPRLAGIGRR